ncbi:hypothetical protein SEA_LILBEANIE_92 [Gordonia phage Lilbeanie]|uniref:Uncharacterized protein n=1 Tax=Gordonia phage Lilbeanie TaxID=2794947 RepID=A0A7T1NXM2_9CAUD|nr:hypothetical protein J1773_gp92 [Gordonia phage Lilbeanie]QPO17170.1 hypothetical protein SEA_LILBEANIE_92 [Gordonia phage Lilbeanie]
MGDTQPQAHAPRAAARLAVEEPRNDIKAVKDDLGAVHVQVRNLCVPGGVLTYAEMQQAQLALDEIREAMSRLTLANEILLNLPTADITAKAREEVRG